ncbi:MAG: hypothetical protein V4736_10770 [Bdellovibrionota bacterium]
MKMKSTIVVLSLVALGGCATGGVKRGHVVMKMSDDEAHVAMGAGEVKVGDHVQLYRNQCSTTGAGIKGDPKQTCKKIGVGHGEVTAALNNDYSTVKFPDGTKFSEGDTIEKHGH